MRIFKDIDIELSFENLIYELQGSEGPYNALNCRSIFAKETLIIGLFCGKWPTCRDKASFGSSPPCNASWILMWIMLRAEFSSQTHIRFAPLLENFSKVSSQHDSLLKMDIELSFENSIYELTRAEFSSQHDSPLKFNTELSFENLLVPFWRFKRVNPDSMVPLLVRFLKSLLAPSLSILNRYRAVVWHICVSPSGDSNLCVPCWRWSQEQLVPVEVKFPQSQLEIWLYKVATPYKDATQLPFEILWSLLFGWVQNLETTQKEDPGGGGRGERGGVRSTDYLVG